MFFASHVSKNKLSFDLDQHVIYMIFIHVIYLWQQIGFFLNLYQTHFLCLLNMKVSLTLG